MDNIILKSIDIEGSIIYYHFEVSEGIRKYFNTDILWIDYGKDLSSVPKSILVIPFVGSLVALSWVTDSVFWVEEIDKTFYYSLRNLKIAYQELYPQYILGGRFVSAYLKGNDVDGPQRASDSDALLLFSGGVDANASYLRNIAKKLLLCNIQGWFEDPSSVLSQADADKRDITEFAIANSVQFQFIRSNFANVIDADYYQKKIGRRIGYNWWYGFQHSMAFISIAIPIAFAKGINEIIIASSYFIGSSSLCASYPTTDIEFRFAESGHTIHDGFELDRQDKIRLLVEHQKMMRRPYPLRVCSFNDHNCCECEKCFRTMLAITAECGDVRDFGFTINGTLKDHFVEVLNKREALMGFDHEREAYWPAIEFAMRKNHELMDSEQKALVDWFLNYDFKRGKRRALRGYYLRNLFPILKRKLFS